MPDTVGYTGSSVATQARRRWQQVDPLLPEPDTLTEASLAVGGHSVTLAGDDGRLVAAGSCEHWAGSADSLDLTWGAARRFRLDVQIAGPDVGDCLDRALSRWREHLDGVEGTDDADSAAVVTWPSRDVDGIVALLRHGFAPRGVVAARHARVGGVADDVPAPAGIGVRRATLDDIDAVVALGLETIRFDAHFGGVVERPGTRAALRQEISEMLTRPQVWVWVAERGDAAVGMLAADAPQSAGWIAPMVREAPVAYNMLTYVSPAERRSGVGAALVAQFHADADATGAPVTLLHYEQTNPLSAPFWGQQGYRPVWTSWEARPAGVMR